MEKNLEDECPICFEINGHNECILLDCCNKYIHKDCFDNWLKRNNNNNCIYCTQNNNYIFDFINKYNAPIPETTIDISHNTIIEINNNAIIRIPQNRVICCCLYSCIASLFLLCIFALAGVRTTLD